MDLKQQETSVAGAEQREPPLLPFAFGPHGLLNIDKPSGVSSRHVVTQIEQVVKPLSAGHAGTLDPLATGVLVVCVGRATKLVDELHRYPKTYDGTFLLGQTSDTEDITGQVTPLPSVPVPTRAALAAAVPRFLGEIMQQPPAFSALKVAGRRSYKLARKGKIIEHQPRPIQIHRIDILEYDYPTLRLRVECGSGTYVRSLGRDLARAAGTDAVMSALRRTAIGPFSIDSAIPPDEVRGDNFGALLQSSRFAVSDLPTLQLRVDQCTALRQTGVLFDLPLPPPGIASRPELAGLAPDGRLFAVLTPSKGDRWKVKTLLG